MQTTTRPADQVFYIGSKGLSQLFASYVASREHLAAPIYLTACEYAMWMVLGSIHNFTLELETTSVPHPPNVVEVEPLPEHIAAARAADESAGAAVEDAAANEPSTSASSIPSYDPDSSPDIELAVVPPVRAKSGEGNNGPVQRRAVLESSHPPALESVAALPVGRRPIINSCGCSCTCMKCSKPPERYPSFRITACYLIGELVKTILEVVTVASVELSLALVLLATAPLFSVLFRFLLEHKRPTLQEACIIVIVFIGLGMRIPEIGNAPVGAVIGGLVSAASAAWISSFKSLIFDPPTAPHVLSYMYRFGPLLCVVTSVIMISTELSTLKHAFRSTDEAIETLSFGLMFAMLAAPSSVVSKRLQKLLGSFQRTLLGVANNVLVALVSIAVLGSADPTPLAIIGSLCVFLSPAIHFVNVEKWARKAWSGFQQTVIAVRRVVV
jgi:hypothetical protein